MKKWLSFFTSQVMMVFIDSAYRIGQLSGCRRSFGFSFSEVIDNENFV
jgi:hypothetical protein